MSGDSVLAVLARLEEGQKTIREELGTLASEQARLRTDVMARLDRQQNDNTISEHAGFNRKELRIACPTPVFRPMTPAPGRIN
jgi:hypothetical protein